MEKSEDGKYEKEFLLDLISSAVNSEPFRKTIREPDWEKLYSLARYHHVENTIYPSMLVINSGKAAACKINCEDQYRFAAVQQETYTESEELLFKALELMKIHFLKTEESVLPGLYETAGLRAPRPLKILVSEDSWEAVADVMQKLGYREQVRKQKTLIRKNKKEVKQEFREKEYRKPGGVHVIFVEGFNFTNDRMRKYFNKSPEYFELETEKKYTHSADVNQFYIYYLSLLAERFARGTMEMRDIADIWVLYPACYSAIDWETVNTTFEKFGIDLFADYIIKLAAIWFGYQTFKEAAELYQMQEYIISKGTNRRGENGGLVPMMEELADTERLTPEEREKQMRKQMLFPDIDYMEIMYPDVANHPDRIYWYWIKRLVSARYRRFKTTSTEKNAIKKNKKKEKHLIKLKKRYSEKNEKKITYNINKQFREMAEGFKWEFDALGRSFKNIFRRP